MRLSELLGRPVRDERGRALGVLRDVRIPAQKEGPLLAGPVGDLVIGPATMRSSISFAWGYAEHRASGPAWLRRILSSDRPTAIQCIPARHVVSWGPEAIVVAADARPAPFRGAGR
jgi:hypothetical protein